MKRYCAHPITISALCCVFTSLQKKTRRFQELTKILNKRKSIIIELEDLTFVRKVGEGAFSGMLSYFLSFYSFLLFSPLFFLFFRIPRLIYYPRGMGRILEWSTRSYQKAEVNGG